LRLNPNDAFWKPSGALLMFLVAHPERQSTAGTLISAFGKRAAIGSLTEICAVHVRDQHHVDRLRVDAGGRPGQRQQADRRARCRAIARVSISTSLAPVLTTIDCRDQGAAVDWTFWMSDENMSKAPEGFQKASFGFNRKIFSNLADKVTRYDLGQGGRARHHRGRSERPTPPAIPLSSSRRGRGDCSSRATPPTFRTCSCAIRLARYVRQRAGEGRADAPTHLRHGVADKLLVSGYHFPFPGLGYIEKAGTGYRLVPAA